MYYLETTALGMEFLLKNDLEMHDCTVQYT
jgi:hypothetical protein